jgi:hypothetical protein
MKKPSKRNGKIDLLPAAIHDLVDDQIRKGVSAEKIVQQLKADCNISINDGTMRTYMKRFLHEHIDSQLRRYQGHLENLPGKVDAASSLAELIIIGKCRLGAMIQKEKDLDKTYTSTDKAMEVLRETCVALSSLEMDMGIRKRVPPKSNNTGQEDKDLMVILKEANDRRKAKEETEKKTNDSDKPANSNNKPGIPVTV